MQKSYELTLEQNRLVAGFLRKLEYFDGILFLTTNLLYQFDDAILNRIHLVMKYTRSWIEMQGGLSSDVIGLDEIRPPNFKWISI